MFTTYQGLYQEVVIHDICPFQENSIILILQLRKLEHHEVKHLLKVTLLQNDSQDSRQLASQA